MVANFPGVLINLINLLVIAFYAKTRARALGIFAAAWLCLAAVLAVFISIFERYPLDYASATAGAIMASLSGLFFLSPLRALYVAVRSLDVSAVPTSLSYAQLVQSAVWIVVGCLYPDFFIIGVNAAGATLALVQICMINYVLHRRRALGMRDASGGVPAPGGTHGASKAIEEEEAAAAAAAASAVAPAGVASGAAPAEAGVSVKESLRARAELEVEGAV